MNQKFRPWSTFFGSLCCHLLILLCYSFRSMVIVWSVLTSFKLPVDHLYRFFQVSFSILFTIVLHFLGTWRSKRDWYFRLSGSLSGTRQTTYAATSRRPSRMNWRNLLYYLGICSTWWLDGSYGLSIHKCMKVLLCFHEVYGRELLLWYEWSPLYLRRILMT